MSRYPQDLNVNLSMVSDDFDNNFLNSAAAEWNTCGDTPLIHTDVDGIVVFIDRVNGVGISNNETTIMGERVFLDARGDLPTTVTNHGALTKAPPPTGWRACSCKSNISKLQHILATPLLQVDITLARVLMGPNVETWGQARRNEPLAGFIPLASRGASTDQSSGRASVRNFSAKV